MLFPTANRLGYFSLLGVNKGRALGMLQEPQGAAVNNTRVVHLLLADG